MKSRGCDDYDKLIDLIVADRLKDSLSDPCLKYCLAIEGNKVLSSEELAALADTYDANYSSDGSYRGSTVSTFTNKDEFDGQSRPSAVTFKAGQVQNNRAAVPRRCWTCSSPSHVQANCPRARVRNDKVYVPSPVQVKACSIKPDDNVDDEETELMKVQVNRRVIDHEPVIRHDQNTIDDKAVADVCVSANHMEPDPEFVGIDALIDWGTIRKSPLTYVNLMIENQGPFRCLADSSSEIPIAKQDVISRITSEAQPIGQIKLQGIFGETVVISLQVQLCNEQANDMINAQTSRQAVPIVFAVTNAMAQQCDFVVPTDIIRHMESSSSGKPGDTKVVNVVTTRNQSQLTHAGGGNVSVDNAGDHELSEVSNVAETINVDNPVSCLSNDDDRNALVDEQKSDVTLDPLWRLASQSKGGTLVENGLLFHQDEVCGHKVKQLCVPHGRRVQIMRLAHDVDTSGHLGSQKTRERVRLNFFWPYMKRDIAAYTASCEPCQLRARARRTDHVPIGRPTVPFSACHADIIGPIEPPSAKGHKWTFCVIDDCTRWPAVFSLKSLTAKATCDAFFELFAITGWPEIICTDRGTNFCSQLTLEFLARLGVAPRENSPYHKEAAGVIERFNGSFQNMLHHTIQKYGRQCLVWALRSVPNATTSVSPHFLLFGRVPHGPLCVLGETWTGIREEGADVSKPVSRYITDLETDMRNAERYAWEHASEAQEQYAQCCSARTPDISFQVSDRVVVLERDSTRKAFARWKHGKVSHVGSPCGCGVEMSNGSRRQLHANRPKLRHFVARVQHVGVIEDPESDCGEVEYAPSSVDIQCIIPPSTRVDKSTFSHLDEQQQQALLSVVGEFPDLFQDFPGLCGLVYVICISGVVCVLKSDGSIRLACDFRCSSSRAVGGAFSVQNMTGSAAWVAHSL